MGLFDGHERHELEELLEKSLNENARLTELIDRLIPKPHRFRAFLSFTNKKNKLLIMALTLNVGQTDVVSIEIYDSITGNLLDKAVGSAQAYDNDNAAAITATTDASDPTKEDLAAIAGGTANITGHVTADLSAYGLGSAVVLDTPPTPVTVIAPVTVTPAARLAFSTPV